MFYYFRVARSEVGSRNFSEEYKTMIGPVSSNDYDSEFYVSVIAMKVPTHFYVSNIRKFINIYSYMYNSEKKETPELWC